MTFRRTYIRCALMLSIAGLALASARRALAWNYEGHLLVGDIAWQKLDAADRAAVSKLLHAHPHYNEYLTLGAKNATPAAKETDIDEYAFARASTWPDAVRPARPPYRPLIIDPVSEDNVTKYHHPNWHYIDIAYALPGDPNFSLNGKAMDTANGDAVTTIEQSRKGLAGNGADEQRAIDLAWLEHCIGDLHQPLHAISFFSVKFPPPDGDRGGNSIRVVLPPDQPGGKSRAEPLHSFWDGAAGTLNIEKFTIADLPELHKHASALIASHPAASFPQLKSHPTPEEWAQESYEMAKKDAYEDGDIFKLPETSNAYHLPATYVTQAHKDADAQVTLAGYRLADAIHAALHPTAATRP